MKKIGFIILMILAISCHHKIRKGDNIKNTFGKESSNTPMMGWSSWNTFGINISDSIIMGQADAMVEKGLKDAGYNYINIDDGFFGIRDASGNMTSNPIRFPKGLKLVSDYIHSKGLKAGIYSEAGTNSCGSIWSGDTLYGTGAGLYGHDEQDANKYFNEWNFDFIKLDYCGGLKLGLNEKERYTQIYNVLNSVSKHPISINICRWAFPGIWASKVSDSWRISGDIAADWGSIMTIINKNMYLSAFASKGHYNDMDMLEIGRGLPQNEEEVHFGMWCIMSSPLLIGCDMRNIPQQSLDLLKNKELIGLNQDVLGLQAYVVQHRNGTYVFTKDILEKNGLTRAVALYNPTNQTKDFDLDMKDLNLGGKVQLRDLVHHKDLPAVNGDFKTSIAPHSVLILKAIAEKRLEPTVYEAEWAYLPCYDDISNSQTKINFVRDDSAFGGAKVVNIGGTELNYIEWANIYSDKGGEYQLTVWYYPRKFSKMQVTINRDKPFYVSDIKQSGNIKLPAIVKIHLNKGENRIRIGSHYSWCPDIDRIELKRL